MDNRSWQEKQAQIERKWNARQPANTGTSKAGLSDAQIKIAVDYANENGISYAAAVKEIFGATTPVSASDTYSGYESLNEAARDYYINGNTTGKSTTSGNKNKNAVKASIKSESEAQYSGDLRIYRTYPAYVASVITDALLSGALTADEAAELRIELEAENGWDLGPYMQFKATK